MKYWLVVISSLFFAIPMLGHEGDVYGGQVQTATVAPSGVDQTGGVKYQVPAMPLDESQLADPNDPTSNTVYKGPDLRKLPKRDEGGAGNHPLWGTDILIYDTEIGDGQDMDIDEVTNDIYVAFDTYQNTGDSIVVCKSTDGGDTWSVFLLGTNADGSVGNAKVRVARDAGGQGWVTFTGIWYEPSGARILWGRRVQTSGTGAVFEQVAADSVIYADLDADVGTGARVYSTYVRQNATTQSIYSARNLLAGGGWQNTVDLFDDPQVTPSPAIAAGAAGRVSVAFVDDRLTTNQEIRIKRSTDNGVTWLSSEQVSNNGGAYPLAYTEIAFSHGATQTGWIFATFVTGTGGDNIAFYVSTNSGANWTYSNVVGATNDDENMSTLRALKSTGSVTLAYNADPGDSTLFSWATVGNPTSFSTPVRVNDYNATGAWPPVAGWIYRSGSYSAVTYAPHTMGYRPYLDWFGNTAVEEQGDERIRTGIIGLAPNPATRAANLTYSLTRPGNVLAEIFDVQGRTVSRLAIGTKPAGTHSVRIDGASLVPGVYFIRVSSPDGVSSRAWSVVR